MGSVVHFFTCHLSTCRMFIRGRKPAISGQISGQMPFIASNCKKIVACLLLWAAFIGVMVLFAGTSNVSAQPQSSLGTSSDPYAYSSVNGANNGRSITGNRSGGNGTGSNISGGAQDQKENSANSLLPSVLEELYTARLTTEVRQYGYDLFGWGKAADRMRRTGHNQPGLPAGIVQDDYVLSTGDKIEVIIRGQINTQKTYEINRQGLLVIDDFSPITAAGRALGDIRRALENETAQLHNTKIYVSLAAVRQITILVAGHVARPGRQVLSAFHSVLDALHAAGGIPKTGSLRNVRLVRKGFSRSIDLYDLLIQSGQSTDMLLQDGDRIIVPAIGPTLAVAGAVKRPGVYEIRSGELLSLKQMLFMGGGLLVPGRHRHILLDLTDQGDESVREIKEMQKPVFGNGSILNVAPTQQKRISSVTLRGHTRQPGTHDLGEAATLQALFGKGHLFGDDIYPLIGVIARKDPQRMSEILVDFSPLQVRQGDFDRRLQDGDILYLFSTSQIRQVMRLSPQEELPGEAVQRQPKHSANSAGRPPDAIKMAAFSRSAGSTDSAVSTDSGAFIAFGKNGQVESQNTTARDDYTPAVITAFLQERAAFIRGAVRQPGGYPVTQGTTLEDLLAVAGGLTLEAARNNIEVTSRLPFTSGPRTPENQAPEEEIQQSPETDETGEETESGEETRRQHHGKTLRAGGFSRRRSVNLHDTLAQNVAIGPGDTVRVNQKFDRVAARNVHIVGEVHYPGDYDLMPADTLLDLIERAGGLKPHAYPAGTVFSRRTERRREEDRFRSQARDLQLRLAASLQQGDARDKPDMAQIAAVQSLIGRLERAKAVGRITVEADPGILYADPEQDILLEPGDRIFIPKRPLTVRVSGEVLSPSALQFRKEKEPLDYIREAGGFTYYGDKSRSFVIYPDGSADPLQVSAWNHRAIFIPPGSTIVVPRDPKPFDFLESAERVSQVLANLAISGLYVEAIGDDD